MNRHVSSTPILALLTVGGVLLLLSVIQPPAPATEGTAGPVSARYRIDAWQSEPGTLFGSFTGSVDPERTLLGVYSDALATPSAGQAPDLPVFDLGLQLSQTDAQLRGFVDLSNTLVFAQETTIQATPVRPTPLPGTPAPGATPLGVGPALQGTLSGSDLRLESDRVSGVVGGQPVERQFLLDGDVEWSQTQVTIRGEYRETIWEYLPEPITVIGTFELTQPVYGTSLDILPTPTPRATAIPTETVRPGVETPTRIPPDQVVGTIYLPSLTNREAESR